MTDQLRQSGLRQGGTLGRRGLLGGAAAAGALLAAPGASGETAPLPLTTAFPEKAAMRLLRTRPPLLETPFEVFDQGALTPNDRFFVRWHWAVIPESVDAVTFRLTVRGHVNQTLSLSLADLLAMRRTELVAVNQCSGNSRRFFAPHVPGAQWGNGGMGNARWTGVALRDVLDRAGVRAGAVAVAFDGLDEPVVEEAPDFVKSLAIDHARDGEVMIAFQMNGAQLPLLNGFPLRLVVPGWYSTYWIKMLSAIEVLDHPYDGFWMTRAYTIPATPHADVAPDAKGFPTEPISRMVPRSFITSLGAEARLRAGERVTLRGIAFGGDRGVRQVDVSTDGGQSWGAADLGADPGRYGMRTWQAAFTPGTPGTQTLMVRCTSTSGETQPDRPNWNPGGFMRNVIEATSITVA